MKTLDVKELRIGNYVLLNAIDDVVEITGLYECGLVEYRSLKEPDEIWEDSQTGFVGIEINKEWLQKLGFSSFQGIEYSRVINDIHIRCDSQGGWMCIQDDSDDENFFIFRHIKFVHEFQNIVFNITKHELILN